MKSLKFKSYDSNVIRAVIQMQLLKDCNRCIILWCKGIGPGEAILATYLSLIIIVNISTGIWANNEAENWRESVNESAIYQAIARGEETIDLLHEEFAIGGLQTVMQWGRQSYNSMGLLVFSVLASIITTCLLSLPKLFVEKIEETFMNHNIQMFEIKNLDLFLGLSLLINLTVAFFDIRGILTSMSFIVMY